MAIGKGERDRRDAGGRRAHLVGSLPAPDSRQAMELGLDALGDSLATLPDGETGDRFQWVVHIVEGMRQHPDLELRKDGDWSDYNKAPVFKVKRGHKLRGDTLKFGHVESFEESWAIFEDLRSRSGRTGLAFQQGVPADLDMALFVFGPPYCFLHRRPFTEATLAEVREIHRRAGRDVVFQIEAPVEQVFVAKMPGPLQPLMAVMMARGITGLAARSPERARFGVHLCVGDLNHKALTRMKDCRPIVVLANALARRWPKDRPLEYVHVPFAAAAVPPPLEDRWYAPLRDLRLPPGVELIAGFAHEEQDFEQQRRIRDLIEGLTGRRTGVSTTCGLGRRTPDAAKAAMARVFDLTTD